MKALSLNATPRQETGKGAGRTLRRDGRIPAVLYGPSREPLKLSVDTKEMTDLLMKAGTRQVMLTLSVEGFKDRGKLAMIKELQTHPVSRRFVHADFYEVAEDKPLAMNVPVDILGIAKGVDLGGMLQVVRRELLVKCLPKDMPENIQIDVSELDMGDSIHVEEIEMPEGIELPHTVNFTVVAVVSPAKAEPEPGEEEEGEEDLEGEGEEAAEGEETEEA